MAAPYQVADFCTHCQPKILAIVLRLLPPPEPGNPLDGLLPHEAPREKGGT